MTTIDLPSSTLIEEARFVRDVTDWLAFETLPAHAVVWRPRWTEMIVVDNRGFLCTLVSQLARGEFAGLRRIGSTGPWAQVRSFEDRDDQPGGWPHELHPHHRSLGTPHGVWKLLAADLPNVAADLWTWATTGTAPADHPEPTAYPRPGQSFW